MYLTPCFTETTNSKYSKMRLTLLALFPQVGWGAKMGSQVFTNLSFEGFERFESFECFESFEGFECLEGVGILSPAPRK